MQGQLVTAAIAFLTATFLGVVVTLVVRSSALRYGLVDAVTSSRKIHANPIPRLGGVAIAIAFFVAALTALLVDQEFASATFRHMGAFAFLVAAAIVLVSVGVWDDVRGIGARAKLAAQVVAALGLYLAGFHIDEISLFPGHSFSLGMLSPLVTVFWVISVINALNLIDGMDGLAGGVALIATLGGMILAIAHQDWTTCMILAALGGATVGFLVFNSHPASIFMGDTGSMFLGGVLAVGAVRAARAPDGIAVVVPLLLLGLPILDMTLAFFRRLLLGRSPFSADKDHLHHRLMLRFGMGHRRSVFTLYGIATAFLLLAMAAAVASRQQFAAVVVLAVAFVFFVIWRAGYLGAGVRFVATRRRNTELQRETRVVRGVLRDAVTLEGIWAALEPACELLRAARLELHVLRPGGETVWQRARSQGDGSSVVAQVPLRFRRDVIGKLIVVWRDGRTEVDRDEELALEALATSTQEALTRCDVATDAAGAGASPAMASEQFRAHG